MYSGRSLPTTIILHLQKAPNFEDRSMVEQYYFYFATRGHSQGAADGL